MAEAAKVMNQQGETESGLPRIKLDTLQYKTDFVTIAGFFFAIALIVSALVVGGSPQAFVNPAALMIVVGGTLAVTAISYSRNDLAKLGPMMGTTTFSPVREPSVVARNLMDLAVFARAKGFLALGQFESELQKDPYFKFGFEFLIDGFEPARIQMILQQDLDAMMENCRKSSGILRRAAEVAPAMGLIGTLIGLVQMLSVLKEPDNIGPAMAIALLTTFYGALLGTVIISPLAAKIERNAAQDALIKVLIKTTVLSISQQENPRQLEVQLNAILPPDQRIVYFK